MKCHLSSGIELIVSFSTVYKTPYLQKCHILPFVKFGQYRPISILPLISKCIENSVNEQLTDFFESNKLLSIHQYRFRKNHSTTYLTLDMFDKILIVNQKETLL